VKVHPRHWPKVAAVYAAVYFAIVTAAAAHWGF
jgi:hypothetical protein